MCTKGELRVTGLNTINLIAGHIELCTGAEWRAVCSKEWYVADAMVVCSQLGFPAEGEDIFMVVYYTYIEYILPSHNYRSHILP